jgi:hypothetical protein
VTDRNYDFDTDGRFYEDELPEDMTDMDYDEWFELSWVDVVRMGPTPVRRSGES